MEITIKINDKAARAIAGIAHNAGTAEMYVNTLSRLFNAVLYNQDDLGMDDTEAITTLQTLGLLRSDIEDIAGSGLRQFPFEPAITVEKVDFGPADATTPSVADATVFVTDENTKATAITKQALEREETHTADDQEGTDK